MDQGQSKSQIIILQGKSEDTRHTNSNVKVEMANVQKTIQNYKILLVSKRIMQWKSKRLLFEVGLKQLSTKEAALQKRSLLAAGEK